MIRFLKTRKDFKIVGENIVAKGILYDYEDYDKNKKRKGDVIGNATYKSTRVESKAYSEFFLDSKKISIHVFHLIGMSYFGLLRYRFGRKELLIESNYMPSFIINFRRYMQNITIYSIDPKLPKRSSIITGKNELEKDGNNLSIVLKNILENDVNKERFTLIIKNILPFVDDMAIEKFSDKSLIASLKETYSDKKYYPASLLSDGTISIISLIIILYFENKNIIIIEEPSRGIHPYLIDKIVNMMKDVSIEKQVIITTHNP